MRPANAQLAAVVQPPRDRRAAAPAAVGRETAASAVTTSGADAVAAHQRLRQLVVAVGVAVEVLDHRRQQVERADLGARALGEHADQPEVVGVLVGDDDPLEVLDPVAECSRSAASSAVSDSPEFGPTSTSVSGSSSIR